MVRKKICCFCCTSHLRSTRRPQDSSAYFKHSSPRVLLKYRHARCVQCDSEKEIEVQFRRPQKWKKMPKFEIHETFGGEKKKTFGGQFFRPLFTVAYSPAPSTSGHEIFFCQRGVEHISRLKMSLRSTYSLAMSLFVVVRHPNLSISLQGYSRALSRLE